MIDCFLIGKYQKKRIVTFFWYKFKIIMGETMDKNKHTTKKHIYQTSKTNMTIISISGKKRSRTFCVKNGSIKNTNSPKKEKLQETNIDVDFEIMDIRRFYKQHIKNINFFKIGSTRIPIYKDTSFCKWENLPLVKCSASGHQLCKMSIYKKYLCYVQKMFENNNVRKGKTQIIKNLYSSVRQKKDNLDQSFIENMLKITINHKSLFRKVDFEKRELSCFFFEHPMKIDRYEILKKPIDKWTSETLDDHFCRSYRIQNIHMDPEMKIIFHEEDEHQSMYYLCEFNGMLEYKNQSAQFWIHYSLLVPNPKYRKQIMQYKNKLNF